MIKISFLGHASFLVESKEIRIVTDPFDSKIGFSPVPVSADVITISHAHFDHQAKESVGGTPVVLTQPGQKKVKGINFQGIEAFHDSQDGAERGKIVIFKFTLEDITFCHLGDLGHLLSPEKIQEIGPVDVLMIPVGDIYTINFEDAITVVKSLNPKIVLPMHYMEEGLAFELDPAEKFLASSGLNYIRENFLELEKKDLPGQRIIVLNRR